MELNNDLENTVAMLHLIREMDYRDPEKCARMEIYLMRALENGLHRHASRGDAIKRMIGDLTTLLEEVCSIVNARAKLYPAKLLEGYDAEVKFYETFVAKLRRMLDQMYSVS